LAKQRNKMAKLTSLLFTFSATLLLFLLVLPSLLTQSEAQFIGTPGCPILAEASFFSRNSGDSKVVGIITFFEVDSGGKQTIVKGIFTETMIETTSDDDDDDDDVKNRIGYTIDLVDDDDFKVFDLTPYLFKKSDTTTVASLSTSAAPLQICGPDTIIGKTIVISKDETELARAEVVMADSNFVL